MATLVFLLGFYATTGQAQFNSLPALRPLPEQAQIIDQRQFNVLDNVAPPYEVNATTPFVWPGVTLDSLRERPFHVYDPEFYDIIGSNPSLTQIANSSSGDPIFHEAVTWHAPSDEMFFVQNAGSPAAGTGLNKSSVVQKISLAQAEQKRLGNLTEWVDITVVGSEPQVINPNGGTNYKGNLIFAGEGQGDRIPSALYLVNPEEPYNATVLINNYFGRQFNSLNDVSINPRNKEIYFTDTMYGHWQYFRPEPGLQNQVYRFNPDTGAIRVAADGFVSPNGLTFSPDGTYAYVTDSGISQALFGVNYTRPASVYRFDVREDGTWDNRRTFAYVHARVPDGVHTDSRGNVYTGCEDGVHVWNPSGKLIGKIYTGIVAPNFQFAGNGRMIIMGRTKLWYATLAASGAPIQ